MVFEGVLVRNLLSVPVQVGQAGPGAARVHHVPGVPARAEGGPDHQRGLLAAAVTLRARKAVAVTIR